MNYHPEYINDGHYLILDREYGHRLCKIKFLDDKLPENLREKIAIELTDLIKSILANNVAGDPGDIEAAGGQGEV